MRCPSPWSIVARRPHVAPGPLVELPVRVAPVQPVAVVQRVAVQPLLPSHVG